MLSTQLPTPSLQKISTLHVPGRNRSVSAGNPTRIISPDFSPPVEISKLPILNGSVYVVRDDLLPGGTKQRAAVPYLKALRAQGYTTFVYASPFAGFAQIALASACNDLSLQCLICAENDPSKPGLQPHAFSKLAEKFGAKLVLSETLKQAENLAKEFERLDHRYLKIPLGFNTEIFRNELEREVRKQWSYVEEVVVPRRLWLPLGSGTLATVFSKVLPENVEIHCVDVHVLQPNDSRIQKLRALPRIHVHSAPERFAEPAQSLPPIASNIHYDAKLWAPIYASAGDGDLWWNVAR